MGGTIIGIRQQQHAASVAQVAAQLAQLIHQTACAGKVLRRIVDDKQVTVLGDGLGEQVKCRDGQALAFQRIGQGGSQRLLAVVGGVVHMAALSAGQLVDGRGDPAFTVKGHVGRAGGGIIAVIVVVKLCGIQHLALFPADQDQPAGGQVLCAVLGRKGRVDCRIFQLPDDMAALGGVLVQQLGDDLVLIAGLGQIVNGHILRQIVGHLSGALAQGVEPRLGEKRNRKVPGINASSTADIAFMLLIFSLLQHQWILTVVWRDVFRLPQKTISRKMTLSLRNVTFFRFVLIRTTS